MTSKIIILLKVYTTFCILKSIKASGEDTCNDKMIDITISPPPFVFYLNETENWILYEMDNKTGAKCLDGTNYKFNFQKGKEDGLKKFMIFFPGGGYCGYDNIGFLPSCIERAKTDYGSSRFKGDNGSDYQTNYSWGYFSSNDSLNPTFSNWNKVFLSYCDGTLFQGYREEPMEFNGSQLYFRGYNNTITAFNFLKEKMGLFDAEEVILNGASSGGQAVLVWMNYIRNFLPFWIKLKGISDGGLFIDIVNQNSQCNLFRKHMLTIANYTNSRNLIIFDDCEFKNSSYEFYKCMIPEYVAQNIKTEMFIVNSQNDFEFMRTAYGLNCLDHGLSSCDSTVTQKIIDFREHFLDISLNLKVKKPKWGFWLRRCLEHYYLNSAAWMGNNFTVFSVENNELKDLRGALYEWYINGTSASYIDVKDWQHECP